MFPEPPLLSLEGVSKTFPGVRAAHGRRLGRRGRRDRLPGRPERRRQVDADEHHRRDLPTRHGHGLGCRLRREDRQPRRCRVARHRVRPSRADAGVEHERRCQHLPPTRAHPARTPRLQSDARGELPNDLDARLRDRPGPPRRTAQPGREGGGGDRQGDAPRASHPHPRRGDRPARRRRRRAPVRARPVAEAARHCDHLHQPSPRRGRAHLRPHRRAARRRESR